MEEFKTKKFKLKDGDWWFEDWKTPFDFVGKTIGKYLIIDKVLYESNKSLSFNTLKYYLVQNVENNLFSIVKATAIEKIFRSNSNKDYLGIKYVDEDEPFYFNWQSFFEVVERRKPGEFICRDKRRYRKELEEYDASLKRYEEYVEQGKITYKNCLDYFNNLDEIKFNKALNKIVNEYGFKEVTDVSGFNNCLYIMVLDRYKQFYVGKCEKKLSDRLKKHWKSNMNSYICPVRGEYNRLGIDFFKMFDTTRIFVLNDFTKVLQNDIENARRYLNIANIFGTDDDSELSLIERTVINSCPIAFSLNDRMDILTSPIYNRLSDYFQCNIQNLTIKDYNDYILNGGNFYGSYEKAND